MTAANSYDELGRLKTKKRHNSTDSENFEYNIRNWTTKITSGTYQEQLFYNALPSGAIGTPCYNGNISYAVTGNTSSMPMRSYSYNYDEFNRLKRGDAYYYTTSPSTFEGHFEDFTYDKMGNIKYLSRSKTGSSLIDFLSFTYNGNQVTAISDSQGSQNQYSVKEYQNKSNTTNEMSYDVNGNLVKDLDRDIVAIKYNLLNLPEYVQFKSGNVIKNLYNAGGQKLRSDYYTRLTAITPLVDGQVLNPVYNSTDYTYTGTAYVDNKEYAISKTYNSGSGNYTDSYTYDKAYTPEGYVTTLSNPQYYYFRKDHLGNNREVWLANTGATIQRTQYYPSGLPWAESTGQELQNKKYNGKEFVEAHGYDTYDYGARGYYSAIGRFSTIDPLSELHPNLSTYAYCNNNSINYIDPLGLDTVPVNKLPDKWPNYNPEEDVVSLGEVTVTAKKNSKTDDNSTTDYIGYTTAAIGFNNDLLKTTWKLSSNDAQWHSAYQISQTLKINGIKVQPKAIKKAIPKVFRVAGKTVIVINGVILVYEVGKDIIDGNYYTAGTRIIVFAIEEGLNAIPYVGPILSIGATIVDGIYSEKLYNYVEESLDNK